MGIICSRDHACRDNTSPHHAEDTSCISYLFGYTYKRHDHNHDHGHEHEHEHEHDHHGHHEIEHDNCQCDYARNTDCCSGSDNHNH